MRSLAFEHSNIVYVTEMVRSQLPPIRFLDPDFLELSDFRLERHKIKILAFVAHSRCGKVGLHER